MNSGSDKACTTNYVQAITLDGCIKRPSCELWIGQGLHSSFCARMDRPSQDIVSPADSTSSNSILPK